MKAARALYDEGRRFGKMNRDAEAVASYEQALVQLRGVSRDDASAIAIRALVNKGWRLTRMKRWDEALAAYDEVEARFTEAADPLLQVEVARALLNKGKTLERSGRREESLAVYEEVARRFALSAMSSFVPRLLTLSSTRLARWESSGATARRSPPLTR